MKERISTLSRREILLGSSATTVAALSGCLGGNDETDDSQEDETDSTEEESETPTDSPDESQTEDNDEEDGENEEGEEDQSISGTPGIDPEFINEFIESGVLPPVEDGYDTRLSDINSDQNGSVELLFDTTELLDEQTEVAYTSDAIIISIRDEDEIEESAIEQYDITIGDENDETIDYHIKTEWMVDVAREEMNFTELEAKIFDTV